MVIWQVKTAVGSNGVQLMVGQGAAKHTARGAIGTVENAVGVRHPVGVVGRPQATLVKRAVVRNERQTSNFGRNFGPHCRKIGGVAGVGIAQPVNVGKPAVVAGARTDEPVKFFGNISVPHYHYTYAANAGAHVVGGFKIYGCKGFHDDIFLIIFCKGSAMVCQNVA
jgi:hypothetical protein